MNKISTKFLLFICLSCWQINSFAQDSSRLQISLLTCTPGEDLYSTFGHSAIRVIDSNSLNDIVYNYGTFNFETEGFYLKFIRGKLLYYVSTENFQDFRSDYQSQNRGITEQVLNLSAIEKINIRHFLNENLKTANKFYKYDFLFDNCTTRLRDIIKKQQSAEFCKKPVMDEGTSFRQAIHFYLDKSYQNWSKLGIDLIMGLPGDTKMTAAQMQFLPDNLMMSIDSSNSSLIVSSKKLYAIKETTNEKPFFTPMVVFLSLLIFFIILSFVNSKMSRAFLQGMDGLLFFFAGTLGIIFIFLWTCTDHTMFKDNFNLAWALPTHFIMSFFVASNKGWVKKYFAFTALSLTILLLVWFFLPQQMNRGLLPVVLLLIFRSIKKWIGSA